jgi:flagellar P-ring protein precursor FlgI
VMQSGLINATAGSMPGKALMPMLNGRPDYALADALKKVPPQAFSRGRTVTTPRTSIGVSEDGKKLALVKDGVSLQQLVDGLNGLGIGPRDLIGILQAIKAAGAIQADIEVM